MNILITGGSRGIGKAIAKSLAEDGHRIVIIGRNPDSLEEAKKELGEHVQSYRADITSPEEVEALKQFLADNFLPDGLVLSAAAFGDPATGRSVTEPSPEELSEILNANVTANYRLVRNLLPLLKNSGNARVVIIGSTAGIRQDKGGIYGISKWALQGYASNLRAELKETGIGVSLVNPGGTFTERRKKDGAHDRHLAESSDFGILIAALFRMSPQAVLERVDLRPLAGDTY